MSPEEKRAKKREYNNSPEGKAAKQACNELNKEKGTWVSRTSSLTDVGAHILGVCRMLSLSQVHNEETKDTRVQASRVARLGI